jgi:hypothetical protein
LIRHASRRVTSPVRVLTVAMIEAALQTTLVTAVGGAALLAARLHAASRAAIALPAIAVRANPEHRLASLAATNPRSQYHFSMNRHTSTPADFDNGNGSCQGKTSFDGRLPGEGCHARTPLLRTAGFSTGPPQPQYNFSSKCFNADD